MGNLSASRMLSKTSKARYICLTQKRNRTIRYLIDTSCTIRLCYWNKVISVTLRDNAAESRADGDSKLITNLITLIPNKAQEQAKSLPGRLNRITPSQYA